MERGRTLAQEQQRLETACVTDTGAVVVGGGSHDRLLPPRPVALKSEPLMGIGREK